MDLSKESTGNIVNSIIGLLIAIIYAVVITFIVNFKKLREKKSNQLLLDLCIGHLLAGMFHFYGLFTLAPVGKLVFSGYVYSSISLLMLSMDRFIFIVYPFRYSSKLYDRIHIGFIFASPLSCMIYLGRNFLTGFDKRISGSSESMMSFPISFISVIVILLGLNFTVYAIICKQRKLIKAQCRVTSVTPVTEGSATSNTRERSPPRATTISDSRKNTGTISRIREARAFFSCFGCVITFSLLWIPCVLMAILRRFNNLHVSDTEFKLALVLAAGCNPLSDLLIFVWFNVDLRVSIKKTIRKFIHPLV